MIGVRLLVALMVVALCASSWLTARSRLAGWHRLPLDYTLGLYTVTYAIGCVVLYLFQADYLYRFYGAVAFVPGQVSYSLVLLVGAMPFIFVPWTVVALAGAGGGVRHARSMVRIRPPIRAEALVGAIGVVLAGSFVVVAPVALSLIDNAIRDLSATTSAALLYAQRQEVFQNVSFLQGGIIYSVLPPMAAIILFWPSRRPWITRAIGALLAIVAALLNLGMFQIGPTLSFLLTCVFCYAALRHGRPNPLAIGVTLTLGILILSLYSLVKATSSELGQFELFAMRLPIPLPYLIQMSGETAPPGTTMFSLSFELGEYMFPELRAAQRFVAMPQPAFVDAWFTFNIFAGIATLILIGIMIVLFGRLLAAYGFGREERDGRMILWSVVAGPVLYYAFQVDILSLFTSAYSITFAIIPTLAILTLNMLMPRTAASRQLTQG
jgi:hypothetical protein